VFVRSNGARASAAVSASMPWLVATELRSDVPAVRGGLRVSVPGMFSGALKPYECRRRRSRNAIRRSSSVSTSRWDSR
jgi:hypothetical protein